jgi:segregation and condensation protein B
MEEEKQHEAAGQPGTELLAGERNSPEVSVALSEGGEAAPAGTGDAPEAAGADALSAEVAGEQAEVSAPESELAEAPVSSDAGDEIAEDVLSEEAGSAEPDDELLEDAQGTEGDGAGSPEAGETAEADQEPTEDTEDAPLPDGRGSVSDGDSDTETSISAFELMGSTEEQATEAETDAATLKAVLEAIVYVLPEPVPAAQMAAALNQPVERVEAILRELMDDTAKPDRGVFVREVAGGYQVATKPEHHEAIREFVKNLKQPLKLSGAALETLAVIAYKQPVTAPEIMDIRGVQGVGVLKTLLDRKLITTAGRKNVIGKPILYKTTKEFLTQFGLNRLSELPTLKEFEEIRRQSFSDDEVEERPEADASAPLAEQAAQLKLGGAAGPEADSHAEAAIAADAGLQPAALPDSGPAGDDVSPGAEPEADPHAEAEPAAEADPQPEAPPAPEIGPESEENHG